MAVSFPLSVIIGAVDKISKPLSLIDTKIGKFGKKTVEIGKQFAVATAPLAIMAGVAVHTASEFERSMNRVRALSGATGADFEALKAQALDLGSRTEFSARQAAEAQGDLAAAGLGVLQIQKAMSPVLDLATSAQVGLAEAAEMSTSVMAGYGKTVDDLPRLMDVMSKASAISTVNLSQLTQSLTEVGPIAAAMKRPFEETNALLAALGNAGIRGSEAGNQLKRVFLELATIDKNLAGKQALQQLGFRREDILDQEGRVRSLLDILGKMEGATPQQLEAIFGKVPITSVTALLTAGVPAIRGIRSELEGAAGASEDMAETMRGGLRGALLSLRSAWESANIKMLDEGTGTALVSVLQGLAGVIQTVTEKHPGLLQIFFVLSAIASTVGPFLSGIGLAAQGVSVLGKLLGIGKAGLLAFSSGLGTVAKVTATKVVPALVKMGIAFATTPFGTVILLIGALIAAGVLLAKHWEKIGAFFARLWEGIKNAFSSAIGWITDKLHGLTSILPKFVREKLGLDESPTTVGARELTQEQKRADAVRAFEAALQVSFENAPKGMRVHPVRNTGIPIDLRLGYAVQ